MSLVVLLVALHWLVGPARTAAQVTPPGIVWSADHEEGTLADWDRDGGGGEFNTGNGDSAAAPIVAHTGIYAVRQVITMDGGSSNGTRLFRWNEADRYPEAYYSVWYFFPQQYQVGFWWNLFQFKSKSADQSRNDAFWQLNVENRPTGEMYLYPYNWVNSRAYPQPTANLPVGRWVHVEAFLRQSDAGAGRLTVWQDGVQIFDLDGITTKYPGGRQDWSVNNYGEDIAPNPVITFLDDAVISTVRVGPDGGTTPLTPTPTQTSTPTQTATATPTATATATPSPTSLPVSCSPRPPILVSSARGAPGRLEVEVVATAPPGSANNRLRQLHFAETTNAVIDVRDRNGAAGAFTVDLADRPQRVSFTVRRVDPTRGTTVKLAVVDDCDPWPTFVGGGVGAF